ncbi:hypothetical protein PC116_g8030 [Phytophthora cactorum]|nr:hypothetical protein PC123_g11626 [Phytophthora cactorum]KAG4244143.1 hypothetical protein PC116_g8030 [Phytophthora cactorum]
MDHEAEELVTSVVRVVGSAHHQHLRKDLNAASHLEGLERNSLR